MKTSAAQRRASDKWDRENKERKNYIVKRSVARTFLKQHILDEDISEFVDILEELKKRL